MVKDFQLINGNYEQIVYSDSINMGIINRTYMGEWKWIYE